MPSLFNVSRTNTSTVHRIIRAKNEAVASVELTEGIVASSAIGTYIKVSAFTAFQKFWQGATLNAVEER